VERARSRRRGRSLRRRRHLHRPEGGRAAARRHRHRGARAGASRRVPRPELRGPRRPASRRSGKRHGGRALADARHQHRPVERAAADRQDGDRAGRRGDRRHRRPGHLGGGVLRPAGPGRATGLRDAAAAVGRRPVSVRVRRPGLRRQQHGSRDVQPDLDRGTVPGRSRRGQADRCRGGGRIGRAARIPQLDWPGDRQAAAPSTARVPHSPRPTTRIWGNGPGPASLPG
jgi:hypothetical protein